MSIERYGVVAVVERTGRFLTITRSQTVIAPGKVCFPGGGIEPGETVEQAIVRECHEELGVAVKPLRQIDESVTAWNVHLRWWAAELAENAVFRPNPEEVESVQWLTLDEMIRHPDTLESNLPFLCAQQKRENERTGDGAQQ